MEEVAENKTKLAMTIDTIIDGLKKRIEGNQPISPGEWLDKASELNVLLMNLEDELIKAEMAVNISMATLMTGGATAAHAKTMTKGMDEYRTYLTLKAKKEHVIEFVRLAKKRVELAHWDQN